MFVQRVALDAVPAYAVVEQSTLVDLLQEFTRDGALRGRLDAVYRRLEAEQPALSEFVGDELAQLEGSSAQALLYFLFLLVYSAFERSFASRLQQVDSEDLRLVLARLIADGEVRETHCPARSYSEDAIAEGQPALMSLISGELDGAAQAVPGVDAIFEALLVEILALTHAVAPVC